MSQALNYWQTLSSNGGGVAVGLIVEVQSAKSIMLESQQALMPTSAVDAVKY